MKKPRSQCLIIIVSFTSVPTSWINRIQKAPHRTINQTHFCRINPAPLIADHIPQQSHVIHPHDCSIAPRHTCISLTQRPLTRTHMRAPAAHLDLAPVYAVYTPDVYPPRGWSWLGTMRSLMSVHHGRWSARVVRARCARIIGKLRGN